MTCSSEISYSVTLSELDVSHLLVMNASEMVCVVVVVVMVGWGGGGREVQLRVRFECVE